MSRSYLVGIAGNTQRPSRTLGLVETLVAEIGLRQAIDSECYDLTDLGAELGGTLDRRFAPPRLASILDAIEAADGLVVASPVYKGAYTGLFKHLFDLIDPKALAGKPVVVAATGGSERHSLVIDHALRPLFGFFGAAVAATGVYGTEREFLDYRPSHTALVARIEQAADEAARLLTVHGRSAPLARTA
jgi:FMN reductase